MIFVTQRTTSWLDSGGTIRAWLSFVCIASSVVACGGTTSKGAPLVPRQEQLAPPPEEVTEPEPDALFFIARIKESQGDVARIAEWCNLPFALDDALAELDQELPKLLRFDLPIDIAVSLVSENSQTTVTPESPAESESPGQTEVDDETEETEEGAVQLEDPPTVHSVASIGVDAPERLVNALKTHGKAVQARESGDYLVELDEDLVCVLGPSRGPTAHRLTCGLARSDLDALALYASERLVNHAFPDKAFYAEVRFAPLRARFGDDMRKLEASVPTLLQEMQLGNQRFDKAFADVASAVAAEAVAWVDGLSTWNFAAEFPSNRSVLLAESTLRFEKGDSYVAHLLQRTSMQQKATPALFWDLPRDVDSATFNTRADVTASEQRIAVTLTELLGGGLEYAGAATGIANAWLKSFRELLESGGTMVMASGRTQPPAKSRQQRSGQAMFDSFGYYLLGVEGDASAYARALRVSVQAFNDSRLRAAAAKALDEDLSKLPLVRARTLTKTKTSPAIELFSLTFSVPKSELPKNLRADKVALHLAMANVGERTWFGFAFSEAEALNTVRKMVDGTDYPKLASREGLTALHGGNILQGSFFTLNSYAKMFAGLPLAANDKPLGDELVRAMPHGGTIPSVFTLSTAAVGPAVTARWELPREIFDDGSALTMAVIAAFGGDVLKKAPADENPEP
jgi:hypothetical protein